MDKKLYKLMNWPEIEGIVYSESDNPHGFMGVHSCAGGVVVQTYQPDAKTVFLLDRTSDLEHRMTMVDESGYFAIFLPIKNLKNYCFLVGKKGINEREVEDPYQFPPIITKKQTELLNKGILYDSYEILGAHQQIINGKEGTLFAVWAPNALRVSVVGDFNLWDGRIHQMRRLWDSGVFEIFIPNVLQGECYKFEIKIKGGFTYLKSDPYGFEYQMRPETASITTNIFEFPWEDAKWISARKRQNFQHSPINIYELHLGSFAKTEDGGFLNYKELALKVIDYVTSMNYTHIELMPIMEHPLDESWGYQVIGYYAPTKRYGTPEDFMYFVNELHKADIGIIIDWVPAHFPKDVHGLASFDGTCLYEHQDPRKGFHPHWGTLIFNYGRPEVSNYLISNALFWIEKYHVDGIRMDAVASMLYLDYGKNDGEWIANMYGGNENLEAVEFLKHLNSCILERGNGAISIAEESTAWPKVTGDLNDDSLGFQFKWNMGWMNDFLGYMQYDPYFRGHHHGELTFSMIYQYCESFMLVFSHDEVVHGKKSMLGKMPGTMEEKFANVRAAFGYMMMHPGKKLSFMGQDMGELEEWDSGKSLSFELLNKQPNRQLNHYIKTLNKFYLDYPALYEMDTLKEGFEWINSISTIENMVVFLRKTKNPEDTLLVVCHFANVERSNYKIGVPFKGKYKEILNSDSSEFGGSGYVNNRIRVSKKSECDMRENSIQIQIAPLSVSVFSYVPYTEKELMQMEQKAIEKQKKKEIEAKKKQLLAKEKAKIKESLKEELAKKIAKAEEKIFEGSESKKGKV